MKSNQRCRLTRVALLVAISMLNYIVLLIVLPFLLMKPSFTEAAGTEPLVRAYDRLPINYAIPHSNGISPTLQILAFQRSGIGYLFTVRLSNVLSHTRYVITSYHHTDIDYSQETITVTTDSAGMASAKIWSRCQVGDTLSGYVFARVEQAGIFQAESNQLDCSDLQTIGDFGSHLANNSNNDDWIYRPSPPGSANIRLWVRNAAGGSGLTGTITIRSTGGYLLSEQSLSNEGDGLYSYSWSIGGLPRADDYRAQLTLSDGKGGLSGLDAFVKLSGRAIWVWGAATETDNPIIWAILTNADYDSNKVGDRDEWLTFNNMPFGTLDPYGTTTYLSVFPRIGFTGTLITDTLQTFLTIAHNTDDIRIEALAGTHEWVETATGLQEGKALCDAILNFNRAGATSDERFDGIHYDVEHDDWFTGNRWDRFIELISYCQNQVDFYNQTYDPIIFGVDIPPHFLTGPSSSGAIKSNWDVLNIVDYITLMDYRDFADVRWDGNTDGIIPRAEPFISDGNALGKSVVIGVELTSNPFDHVTFFEECRAYLDNQLQMVSKHFAMDWSYKGIAIHDYKAWREIRKCDLFLPMILK